MLQFNFCSSASENCSATSVFASGAFHETTKDPKVEGSRSYQSSVTPLWRGTKAPKHLSCCVSVFSGPNTVSESTVSNTELSEFFGPHRVPGRGLSEFTRSPLFVCKCELTESFAELTEFAAELSEFSLPKQYSRNDIPPVS